MTDRFLPSNRIASRMAAAKLHAKAITVVILDFGC